MEKPLFTLGPKQFLSGIAQGAHDLGRLWYKADGITPMAEAATGANTKNGLLMVGAAGISISGIVDTVIDGTTTFMGGVATALLLGDEGHFYSMQMDSPSIDAPTPGSDSFTDLRSGTPITNARSGLQVLECASTSYAFYFQSGQIGRATANAFRGIDAYPTGWTDDYFDSADDVESDSVRTPHRFNDGIYYANQRWVGVISSDGTTTPVHNGHALDLPSGYRALAITDDGTYLVIVCCENDKRYGARGRTRVLFWDTFSASWVREYYISEPYVSGARNIGGVPEVIGRNAVWRCTLSGAKRDLTRKPGVYQSQMLGNRAHSIYGQALIWGGDTPSGNKVLHTLGSLDDTMPSTYMTPVLLGSNNITFVSAEIYEGHVVVGTDGNDIKAYPLSGGTPQTGAVAQTVYIPLEYETDINHVSITFANPLASGDSISLSLLKDEDTPAVDFGTASFAVDKAIRRKRLNSAITADEQVSLKLTYTAGAPKLKTIKVYGTPKPC